MSLLWCYYVRTDVRTMPQITPITELRNTTKEPIFMTINGYGDLVVMSVETLEAMLGKSEIDHKIAVAEEEFSQTGESIEGRKKACS